MAVNSFARLFRGIINADSRVKVSVSPSELPLISGTLGAVGTTVAVNVSGVSNVVLHVKNTGTASGACGVVILEASLDSTDGIDGAWFGIQGAVSNANTAVTSITVGSLAAGAGALISWECSVNAYQWVRVRQTTANAVDTIPTWTIQRGTYATEPLPVTQSTAVTGTVTANEGTALIPLSTTTGSAATTNATVVKASAGTLFGIAASNINAAARYLKVYNKATAPTVGTDVPVITIPLAAMSSRDVSFGAKGLRLSAGISFALTAGATDADTVVVEANEIKVVTSYI